MSEREGCRFNIQLRRPDCRRVPEEGHSARTELVVRIIVDGRGKRMCYVAILASQRLASTKNRRSLLGTNYASNWFLNHYAYSLLFI